MKPDKFIKAIGRNSKGKIITYDIPIEKSILAQYAGLVADNRDLVELTLPDGLTALDCRYNKLKELKLPYSLTYVECDKELFNYDTYNTTKIYIEIFYQK